MHNTFTRLVGLAVTVGVATSAVTGCGSSEPAEQPSATPASSASATPTTSTSPSASPVTKGTVDAGGTVTTAGFTFTVPKGWTATVRGNEGDESVTVSQHNGVATMTQIKIQSLTAAKHPSAQTYKDHLRKQAQDTATDVKDLPDETIDGATTVGITGTLTVAKQKMPFTQFVIMADTKAHIVSIVTSAQSQAAGGAAWREIKKSWKNTP